ncbi:hypothetical protein LTR53_017943 [Teratosphaeriaceae sp. CCFEE 6253]|nr:hypothetical protein LTR53_017943 [Teratosphaeriaceae sp. CCFEE 6253]
MTRDRRTLYDSSERKDEQSLINAFLKWTTMRWRANDWWMLEVASIGPRPRHRCAQGQLAKVLEAAMELARAYCFTRQRSSWRFAVGVLCKKRVSAADGRHICVTTDVAAKSAAEALGEHGGYWEDTCLSKATGGVSETEDRRTCKEAALCCARNQKTSRSSKFCSAIETASQRSSLMTVLPYD